MDADSSSSDPERNNKYRTVIRYRAGPFVKNKYTGANSVLKKYHFGSTRKRFLL